MLSKHLSIAALTVASALALGACANDGSLVGTGATAALPEKPKVDAACAPLAAKIDDLRRDGVADRVEQAATGKGATVAVKRESLAKVAELNKANAEFQQKCSAYTPAPGAAKAATVTPGAAAPAKAAVTKTAAAAKSAANAAAAEKAKAAVPPAVSDAATETKQQ